MPGQRKLGRSTDIRLSMIRGMVTDLLTKGKIETTVTRAKEVEKAAEKIITMAIKEKDNYTTREVLASSAKLDSKSHKLLKSKTSASGKRYDVVERELKTKMVQVDNPSRLAARRQMMKWLVKSSGGADSISNPTNYVFDQIAPKYAGRNGGYTRLTVLGCRRGDGAEMARLELI